MKVWYDTEFWEQGAGKPIIPISYGFVREDGQELYLINGEAPIEAIANEHEWLRQNVLPHLPVELHCRVPHPLWDEGWSAEWDEDHPDFEAIRTPGEIRRTVEAFLLSTPDLELWGWYSAYDHVVLAQTWGTMTDLPKGIPYYTRDVRQLIGKARVPVQQPEGTEHNALADADWTRSVHMWWDDLIVNGGCPGCGKVHGVWCAPYGGPGE